MFLNNNEKWELKKESHSFSRIRIRPKKAFTISFTSKLNPKRGTKLWPLLALFAFYPSLINTPIGIQTSVFKDVYKKHFHSIFTFRTLFFYSISVFYLFGSLFSCFYVHIIQRQNIPYRGAVLGFTAHKDKKNLISVL